MDKKDRERFARYYPDYIEPAVNINEQKLGYLDPIIIDKEKLINDTIILKKVSKDIKILEK